jgi:hypothetical protein
MGKKASTRTRPAAAATAPAALPAETWIVHWDHRAVEEFSAYTDKAARKGALTIVD